MSENRPRKDESQRIEWIDTGKGLAMAIVFIAHLMETLIKREYTYGILEGRFVSSFVVPLFFFLSGVVAREKLPDFRHYFLKYTNTLIIPFLLFNTISFFVLLVVRLFYKGTLVFEFDISILSRVLGTFVTGVPFFNGPTWFLTCLFSVLIIYFIVVLLFKNKIGKIFAMVLITAAGFYSMPFFDSFGFIGKVAKYFWFFPTAMLASGFFIAGSLFRQSLLITLLNSPKKTWAGLLISGALIFTIFDLNTSAFEGEYKVYYMNRLNCGNYFLFYLNGFAGTAFIIFMAKLLENIHILSVYGKNSLLLLGLNGIYYHFINLSISLFMVRHLMGINYGIYLMILAAITTMQLFLCYPFFKPLNTILFFLNDLATTFYKRTGLLKENK